MFITVAGKSGKVAINVTQIAFIDFHDDGTAAIHISGNSITVGETEADRLRQMFLEPDEPEDGYRYPDGSCTPIAQPNGPTAPVGHPGPSGPSGDDPDPEAQPNPTPAAPVPAAEDTEQNQ
ncbi:MAG TPA: hypothetical protein VG273_16460 [Bryobacteraceae bacterium]|nr:hypothetical protein [Bryobacteraceae bacterium]